ncbi:Hypothetical predicted protein [Paramuricea clavata]|uniref:Uncharacterized protein n=1 Tax=Paramuricea clavata TaxID=317549 RepID=A0A7D9HYM2_PARCT|nr:Hypothetical predicted protein [Paramuricea clavata]
MPWNGKKRIRRSDDGKQEQNAGRDRGSSKKRTSENRSKLTRISTKFSRRSKRQCPKDGKSRSRAPRISSANAESRLRSTHGRQQGRRGYGDVKSKRRKENDKKCFRLEGRSPEVEKGIAKVEKKRESTGETRRAEPQD